MVLIDILKFWGFPAAVLGFCFWLLQRKIDKKDEEAQRRERRRVQFDLTVIKQCNASIALGEATARAVQRIPDANCNGDMHKALDYASKIKHEQKDFLAELGIEALYDD